MRFLSNLCLCLFESIDRFLTLLKLVLEDSLSGRLTVLVCDAATTYTPGIAGIPAPAPAPSPSKPKETCLPDTICTDKR